MISFKCSINLHEIKEPISSCNILRDLAKVNYQKISNSWIYIRKTHLCFPTDMCLLAFPIQGQIFSFPLRRPLPQKVHHLLCGCSFSLQTASQYRSDASILKTKDPAKILAMFLTSRLLHHSTTIHQHFSTQLCHLSHMFHSFKTTHIQDTYWVYLARASPRPVPSSMITRINPMAYLPSPSLPKESGLRSS